MTTREKIMDSAVSLFTRQGYDRTTMNQIARNAGLSKGALYYFFKNKSQLFCCIVDEGLDNLEDFTVRCLADFDDHREITGRIVDFCVRLAYENSGFFLMLLGGGIFGENSPVADELEPRLDRLYRIIEASISVGIREGHQISAPRDIAAKAFLGMVYGIISLPGRPAPEICTAGICGLLEAGLFLRR